MIARISCWRTSKLMSLSALTPPNCREMFSSRRIVSPIARCWAAIGASCLCGLCQGSRDVCFRRRVLDPKVGRHYSAPAVLELHQRLDVLDVLASVERVDQRRVLLGDEAPAHLARARELVVVGI